MKKFILLNLATLLLLAACSKNEKEVLDKTDEELFKLAKDTIGFKWYKNNNALLAKSNGSAHFYSFLKTRYNSIAQTQLDENGKVKNNSIFPEGSLIVKELWENENKLARYAILYKNSSNPNADAKGWVWGYIDANGAVADPASNKGKSCINCHLQSSNIDYMLMNKFFE